MGRPSMVRRTMSPHLSSSIVLLIIILSTVSIVTTAFQFNGVFNALCTSRQTVVMMNSGKGHDDHDNKYGNIIFNLSSGNEHDDGDNIVEGNKVDFTATTRNSRSGAQFGRRDAFRTFLFQFAAPITAFSAASSMFPKRALAGDPLFDKNPLTNSALEKFRIWNQAEADNISYGGELAPGSPKGRDSYAKLLIPILAIQADLETIDNTVRQTPILPGLTTAKQILEQPYFTKIGFKKTFNAFADNIYYSDPDRANAYLAGGAMPKNEQTVAYLLRNDILNNVEALVAEIDYLIKVVKKVESGEETTADLYEYLTKAKTSMGKYLDLVPPAELKLGRDYFSQRSS